MFRHKQLGYTIKHVEEGEGLPSMHLALLQYLWHGVRHAFSRCLSLSALMQVPKTALKTPFQQGTVQDVAKKMLQLSRDGLARRGKHEEGFLDPLHEIADVRIPPVTALPFVTSYCVCPDFDPPMVMLLTAKQSPVEHSLLVYLSVCCCVHCLFDCARISP